MTTRITVAILLITWTIIIVCFSAAFFTAREALLTMLDDTLTARATSLLDYSLDPRQPVDSLLPAGDTYSIHDENGKSLRQYEAQPDTSYEPVVIHRAFETHSNGIRYRSVTLITISKQGSSSPQLNISYSRPSERIDRL